MDVIDEMVKSIKELHDASYHQYHLVAKDICSRNASENEVSHFLDDLLGFCSDERFLKLFKQVCRHYYYKLKLPTPVGVVAP